MTRVRLQQGTPEPVLRGPAPLLLRGTTEGARCRDCPFSKDGQAQRPVVGEGIADPDWIIVGEGPGQNEVALGHPFCLVPKTLVLMADLTWQPIGKISVGDKVLGIDECSPKGKGASGHAARKWHVAEVTATYRRHGPAIKVTTDKGELQGSADHPVLVRQGGHYSSSSGSGSWLEMGKTQAGKSRYSRIVFVAPPWTQRTDYWAAWLAGFLDGEGHVLGSKTLRQRKKACKAGFSQNAGPTYERAANAVRLLGYELNAKEESRNNGVVCQRVTVRGGVAETMRFLGEIRPERLVTDFQVALDGKSIRGFSSGRVLRREPIGNRDLIDITTTTGTFIANGFVVHNCGASGQLVNKALDAIGCRRNRLFITNATLCLPTPDATDEDKHKARKCCAPRFVLEMAKYPGKPVLALGNVATQAFLGSGVGISAISGSYHQVDRDGTGLRVVIPTLHPAAILRGGAGVGGAHAPDLAFWNLMYDAAKINSIAAGKDIVFREDDIYVEWQDPKRAEELIRAIVQEARRVQMVAVDTETYVDDEGRHSALQPLNAKLSAIGLATPNWGMSVAWNIVTPMGHRLLAAVMADPNVRTVMHNRLYDRPVLRRHRMPVFGPCDCTLLKHHNAFPGLAHGLQRVATQYFAIAPWKSEFKRGNDTIENLTIYNSRDTLVTARLDEPLDVAIEHTRSRRTYEIDLLCADAAEWMYDVGIPISREVNQKLYDQFWTNMQKARKGIEDKANEPEIREKLWDRLAFEQAKRCRHGSQTRPDSENYIDRQIMRLEEIRKAHTADKWEWKIGSADHLGPLLQIHGLQLDKTSKGKLQITLDVLKPHRADPIVKALYDYRKDKKNEAAQRIVEQDAARLDIRDALWKGIAFEQAKRIRQPGGTPADPEDFEERQKVRLKEIEEAYEKGNWFWKIGSSDHIAAYLKARGVPMYFQTDKGATSTKKEILEGFAHLPEVRSLIDFRENQKMFSTFVYSFFDRHDEEGKLVKWGHAVKYGPETYRLHPRWNVHRITGRWSAEDPTVMNWPKADKKKGRPNLRSQVVAPEGRALVGFDFCLAAGTQVDTPNGSINIEDIEPGQLVYSYDFEQRRPRCRRVARRARTGLRATLKVILDNGAEVRCTPEHRWYVRPWGIGSGAVEVEASDLRPGMRLLPLRRSVVGPKGSEYETLYSYSAFEYVKTHIAVAEAAFGPRPVGYHVHHKNEDQFDNRPENLKYKPAGQHASEHSSVTTKRQWADPEIRARMQHGISASIAARGGYHGTNNPRYGERSGEVGHCPNCGAETYLGGKRPRRFCNRTCYNEFRAKNRGLPRGTVWHDLNHKVVAIVDDGLVVPTYDIEVEDDHNFALSIGVFVHNSQLEARVIALLSSDPFLCEIFHSGKDIHSEFARIVWPDYDELPYERRKVLRDSIKRPEYGAFFGGRVETLWQNIKKDYPDVQLADIARMVSLMTAKMPGVTIWHQQLLREVAKPPHEIRSAIYGRRRCFPLGNADINDVYNFPVQCLAETEHVLTVDGWQRIKFLVPGVDVLQQPSGHTTSDFKLRATGNRAVYELRTQGHSIVSTIEHRFLIYIRGGKVTWKKLRYLKPGDYIAVDTPHVERSLRFTYERVISVVKQRERAQTFDLEIVGDDHGYIAEGLITHNSTGADIMATGLILLMPKLRRDYHNAAPIIQIHDAIVFECDEGEATRLQKDVQECFEQTHTHNDVTIHFPVDPTTGRSWADV